MPEDIREIRRKEYNEYQRYLMSKLISERGGMLTKDATDQEIEKVQNEFYGGLSVLGYKYTGL